jgi:hypothetical protein
MDKRDFLKLGEERGFIGLPCSIEQAEEFILTFRDKDIEFEGPTGDVIARLYWEELDHEGNPVGGCISIPNVHLELAPAIESAIMQAGFAGIAGLSESCAHAYKLGMNPLPRIREILKDLPLTVNFAFFGNGGTFFNADERSATVGVFLDDYGDVTIQVFDEYLNNGKWFSVYLDRDIPLYDNAITSGRAARAIALWLEDSRAFECCSTPDKDWCSGCPFNSAWVRCNRSAAYINKF